MEVYEFECFYEYQDSYFYYKACKTDVKYTVAGDLMDTL